MDLTKLIRLNGNKLTSVLDRLSILEDKARDQHNEFVRECLQARRKKNRKLEGDENGPDQRTT